LPLANPYPAAVMVAKGGEQSELPQSRRQHSATTKL